MSELPDRVIVKDAYKLMTEYPGLFKDLTSRDAVAGAAKDIGVSHSTIEHVIRLTISREGVSINYESKEKAEDQAAAIVRIMGKH